MLHDLCENRQFYAGLRLFPPCTVTVPAHHVYQPMRDSLAQLYMVQVLI